MKLPVYVHNRKNIINMLEHSQIANQSRTINKQQWVGILRASGMSEGDMMKWHLEFERRNPQAHLDFLESLGISEQEIKKIRVDCQRALLQPE